MEAREARREFQKGRLSTEQLLDLVERQERMIQQLAGEVKRLRERLAQYEEAAPEVIDYKYLSYETAGLTFTLDPGGKNHFDIVVTPPK